MLAPIGKKILIGLILTAHAGFPARAGEAWKLVQSTGDVSAGASGGGLTMVSPVQSLPQGATVVTGPSGRAVLQRGSESIVMAPASKLTLPSGANLSLTRVKQHSGMLLFKIGKKPEAHFEVETPYLAAVVKGTAFTVRVTGEGATVHVLEGAVEVATSGRGRAFLTQAGQISSVFASAASDIFTAGAAAIAHADLTLPANVWDVDWLEPGAMVYEPGEGRPQFAPPLPAKAGPVSKPSEMIAAKEPGPDAKDELRGTERDVERRKQGAAAQGPRASEPASERRADQTPKPEKDRAAGPLPESETTKKRASRTLRLGGIRGQIAIDGVEIDLTGPHRPKSLAAGSWIAANQDSDVSFKLGTAIFALTQNSVAVFDGPKGGEIPRFVSGTGCRLDPNTRRFKPVNTMAEDRVEHLNRKREADGLARVPMVSLPAERTPEELCAKLNGPAELARRWDEDERRTLSLLDKAALGVLGFAALACLGMAAYSSRTSRRTFGQSGGDRNAAPPNWLKTMLGR